MERVIALDSGSSFMKAYAGDQKVRFPAVARVIDDQYDHGDTVAFDGQKYVVGESALQTYTDDWEMLEPATQRGFHGSPEQAAQMCYAMQRLGASGNYDVLALSLPYADSQNEDLRNLLKGQQIYEWKDSHGDDHEVHFDKVMIMPQGVGALCVYEAESVERPQTLLLVDIGSCTIDIVALRYNEVTGRYLYLHDKSTSRRSLSTTEFYKRWYSRIREMDGMQNLRKGYFELMALAQADERPILLRHGGRMVDITDAYEITRVWFSARLARLLREDMGDKLLDDVETILLTGGGAALVDKHRLDTAQVTVMSVWDNVHGQFSEASGRLITPDTITAPEAPAKQRDRVRKPAHEVRA